MLHEFLDANRAELIERCRAKVARRAAPRPTPKEMEHGIPLFLGQLTMRQARGAQRRNTRRRRGKPLLGLDARHL